MFVAINNITCQPEYVDRFEELFATRAGAIDKMPGFHRMHVLKPNQEGDDYLIVSYWDSEQHFQDWTQSEAFISGHQRGFADLEQAKREGRPMPMHSKFRTYHVLTD